MAVYFIQNSRTKSVKIGYSRAPSVRMDVLQTSCEDRLDLLLVVESWGSAHEAALHKELAGHRLRGEWFAYSPLVAECIQSVTTGCHWLFRETRVAPVRDELAHRLASAIRAERRKRSMTQLEFAGLCGMRRSTIANLEAGQANPTLQTLAQLSVALGVRVYDMIGDGEAA